MKNIGDVFEVVENVLPSDASKTIMYCEVENKSYEIFYYSYFGDDVCKQCYELESEGAITSEVLEKGFEKIATFIRDSKEYDAEKRNVVTILVDGINEDVKVEQFDKSIGLYKIKKEWKANNL